MTVRKLLFTTLKIIGAFILLIIIYLVSALTLSYFSVNSDFKQKESDAIEIYILTNGVHTDLVLPFQNEYKDWSTLVSPANTKMGNYSPVNVAFGWGDKGFYLQTKTWAELKFKTAFNAMFYLSNSAMHVTFYNKLRESKSCRKIRVSKENYLQLVDYIHNSFTKDNFGQYQQIKDASYFNNDAFYEANGTYGLFYTCNTWANNGLKAASLKACVWTPFDKGIFQQYPIE